MYGFIKGKVVEHNSDNIIIENNSIGYEVFVANPYYYKLNEEYIVYIYLHVREDAFMLFGFENKDLKKLFLKLISVKGIGPKTAIGILANGNLEEIVNAIESCDHKLLTKFPGIGLKASQQIILDLKGKLNFEKEESNNIDLQKKTDLVDTLKALGYKEKDIEKVIKKLDFNKELNILVKEALKGLLK